MATNQGILLTKSPFYIYEAGTAGFTSDIDIRIWNGSFISEPTAINYTISKQTLNSTATSVVMEISKLIESSFDHIADIYNTAATSATKINKLI